LVGKTNNNNNNMQDETKFPTSNLTGTSRS